MNRTSKVGASLAGLALLLTACSSGGGSTSGSSESASASATESASASASGSASGSGGGAQGGELLIWADKLPAPVVQEQCNKFAEANGVKCRVQQMDFANIRENVVKGTSTGDVPDLFMGAHDWLGELVKNGAVAPIDLGSKSGEFSPAATAGVLYDGKNYGVPWAVENLALLTNTDLVKSCPATMDDLVSTGSTLLKDKKVTLPLALQISDVGDPYHWYPLYSASGGYIFGTNSAGSYNPDDLGVGKEGSIAAATALQKMADEKIVKASVTGDIALESFNTGKSPYFITGPWNLPATTKKLGDKVKVCPIPNWDGSQFKATPFSGVQTFFQTTGAKNAAIASTFLSDYVMTTDFMDAMYKADPRPPAWNASAEKASTDANIKAFIDYGKQGIPLPAIPAMAAVWGDLGLAEFKVASGEDPTKTMTAAGDSISKAIAAAQ
jgi:arabinogalactan oligomer / maltooligosaccharide transport system substrate-binding protein